MEPSSRLCWRDARSKWSSSCSRLRYSDLDRNSWEYLGHTVSSVRLFHWRFEGLCIRALWKPVHSKEETEMNRVMLGEIGDWVTGDDNGDDDDDSPCSEFSRFSPTEPSHHHRRTRPRLASGLSRAAWERDKRQLHRSHCSTSWTGFRWWWKASAARSIWRLRRWAWFCTRHLRGTDLSKGSWASAENTSALGPSWSIWSRSQNQLWDDSIAAR